MANNSIFQALRYGFKKHYATRRHYDLRLELDGVLKSWAIPDGPTYRAGVLREAIEMPDHRTEYLSFEGVHKTGPVMFWDRGMWLPDSGFEDVKNSLREGILRFRLRGEKLEGGWILTKVRDARNSRPPVWTLCKQADLFAERYLDGDVLKELPNSVSTGRSMEQIVRDWVTPRDRFKLQIPLFG